MSEEVSVAFDATPVISGRTGIARYVSQLGAALEQQGVRVRRFAVGRSLFPAPPDTRHVKVPGRLLERWWGAVPWPLAEQLVGDVGLVHATGLLVPPTGLPLVVTVHDVAALRFPQLHPPRHLRQQRAQLSGLARAAAVLTVSQSTADDLAQLGISPERMIVSPLGFTPLPAPIHPHASAEGCRYVLTVGETSPRKRYSVVLEALAHVDDAVRLVMAGPRAGDEQRLAQLASSLGLSRRLSRLGAVSDGELAALYAGAAALCFPSVTEGFGLPVLEAMAAGTPVIASDIPATRELAGDAALYCDAADARGWAEAIATLASDDAGREKLAKAGRERAARFTWERTATATLEAYQVALAAGR